MRDPAVVRATRFNELFDLTGEVAVVTGAARGLGRGIAHRLLDCGASVVVVDANAELGARCVAELRVEGGDAHFIAADLMNEEVIVGLVKDVVAAHGRLDILVNNAGIYPYSPLLEMKTDELDRVLDLDLRSPFLLCREAGRAMIKDGIAGRMVNVSSMSAFRSPFAGVAHYDAAKAGLVAMTRSLAIEFGQHHIRVNAIAPGLNLTEGQREAFGMAPSAGEEFYPRFYQSWVKRIPLGRVGHPDDQARVVAFLVSDAAQYVTGQCLVVDGGAILV